MTDGWSGATPRPALANGNAGKNQDPHVSVDFTTVKDNMVYICSLHIFYIIKQFLEDMFFL